MIQLVGVVLVATVGRTLWVSPQPGPEGDGSRERPFRSVHRAVEAAVPGDEVVFLGGRYAMRDFVVVTQKGGPGRWLTLRAADRQRPVFDFSSVKPKRQPWTGGFHAKGASHVRFVRLEIVESHACGLLISDGCEAIDVVECTFRRTFMPGIGAWNSHRVRIVGNDVSRANDPSMRLWGDPNEECPHEAISVAGVKGFEVAWNRVHDSVKEGIDVKEVSAHGTVHHNLVEDLHRQAYYADAWFGLLEDVEFFSNVARRCEWGMVVSVEGRGSELANVRIRHNVFHDNRASGVFFGRWGADGPRRAVTIEHNTLVRNGRLRHWAGATGNIDLRSPNARDVVVRRNLLVAGAGFQMAAFSADPSLLNAKGWELASNRFDRWVAAPLEDNPYGPAHVLDGSEPSFGPVAFENEATGLWRPRDRSLRFGALPEGAAKLPGPPPTLEGFPAYKPSRRLHPLF
ncbi:MAG: right-handed parallel beta-helix repeat-containing protein [Fimbriimonadales bacterium]|nr:right-handed parallel beta-helix repeat-containing protein [Fimbriimonadales bacterium]